VSSASEAVRAALRVGVGLFLTAPFIIWFVFIPSWQWPGLAEILPPLFQSLIQALVSAAAAMAAGFFLFRAMQGFQSKRALQAVEAALLLPNLVPPLFVALGLLAWTPLLGEFPFGTGAVVLAHVLLNAGLVAVALDRLVKSQIGGLAETAMVIGAKPSAFWRKVAFPMLRADLAYLFLFVFSLCFTSFALPLLLSGERVVTLEVAIFDAIRLEGSWDKAVLLAALQSVFLFWMASVLPRPLAAQKGARFSIPYLGSRRSRFLVAVPLLILFAGWTGGLGPALSLGWDPALLAPAVSGLLLSLALGLAVGVSILGLLLIIAYVSPHERLERFLNGYLAPSSAITGFGLLLVPAEGEGAKLALTTAALSMITLPLLYRWMIHSALQSVSRQVAVARTLGAGWSAILFQVVWPQVGARFLRAAGLAALWASGDFAISGILLGTDATLPLVMENLLNNYRFESAQLLLLPLLAAGLSLYGVFVGAARYVAR